MNRFNLLCCCALAIAGVIPVGALLASSPLKVGNLSCVVSYENKSLFKTHLVLKCGFTALDGSVMRKYEGTIDRKGLGLGNIGTRKFSWIVATLGKPENVKLDGKYFGAQAGASVGAGGGANYLTGGFNKKISLQLYSAEGKKGFGLELGGQILTLKEIASGN
ncbi:MAG: DUF992 domain-containing protein [Rhizobiaceae bacterium]